MASAPSLSRQTPHSGRTAQWRWLAGTLGTVAAVVVLYTRVLGVTNHTIAALSFLLIVAAAAAKSTLRVAIAASLAATASFNFFFLPPTGTWMIAEPQNWFALLTLLLVSVLVSRLSALARAREEDAVARRDELARLFDLTRDILLTTEADDPIAALARHVADRFRVGRVSIFRRDERGWHEHPAVDSLGIPGATLDELLARSRPMAEGDVRTYAGADAARSGRGERVWLVPLRLGATTVGVLALATDDVDPGTRDAIAGVIAIAIERQQLLDERREAELVRRNAELRSTLLASMSHDLRTPLTAVTVASSNLGAAGLSESERRDQVDVIRTEVGKLNRLFENIVDLARIETHAITPEPQWVQAADIIDAARQHVGRELEQHPVTVDADDAVVVRVDPRLTSAALAHLVENAAQYSPDGTLIEIRAETKADEVRIVVSDHGPGVAATDVGRIFDRFYRGAAGHQRFGTGMGLAITRGLIAAQGGRVWVENLPEGGARFTIAVPAGIRAVTPDEALEDAE